MMDPSLPTIFVSIASYCDPALACTLDNCLANARYPENVYFGICWQYDTRQQLDLRRFKANNRFRFVEYPFQDSEGGPWARSIAQQFWEGETYAMQVDSHMVFARGWDSSLVLMMRTLPAEKPLITMNAPLFHVDSKGDPHKQTAQGIRTTRLAEWQENLGWAPWFSWGVRNSKCPGRNRFISGNFIFTLGEWTNTIRQDPEHYYHGEEFALTLRSYTHGYDFFLPDSMVAWHMLHSENPPRRHWEHGGTVTENKNRIAFERLRKLAYSDDPADHKCLGRYGLGNVRSRSDYEHFAGLDLRNKRAHPDAYSGRNPDPITIKTDEDWNACVTYEAYCQMQANGSQPPDSRRN